MEVPVVGCSWDRSELGVVVGMTAVHNGIPSAVKLEVAEIFGWATISPEEAIVTALAESDTPVLHTCA